jgi:hypothetical protein
MAVGKFYADAGETKVGNPILGLFMEDYFGTIKAMNDANDAARNAESPEHLSKLEMAASQRIADLVDTQRKASAGDLKSYNDLSGIYLKAKSSESETAANVAAKMADIRANLYMKYRDQATAEAEQLGKKIQLRPENATIVANMGTEAKAEGRSVKDIADRVVSQLRGILAAEKAGGEGEAKYDRAVADVYDALASVGPRGLAAAELVQREMAAQSADEGITPSARYMKVHTPVTFEKAEKDAEQVGRKLGAGVRSGADAGIASMGIDPKDLAGGESSERSSTTGDGGGKGTRGPPGASVRLAGMSDAGAAAFAAAAASGADPNAQIAAAIEAERANLADLRARREQAGTRGLYLRANAYTASPNRMVPEESFRRVRELGNKDPGAVEEWTNALRLNGGNTERAYESMGGNPEERYGPKDFQPMQFEKGGDLGAHIATLIEQASKPVQVQGEGGYLYTRTPDGEISYVKDGKTVKVAKGSDAYKAIETEIGVKLPQTAEAFLETQPREVRDLFARAVIKNDAEAARQVAADDVRAAYGTALRGASDNPKRIPEVLTAVTALPDGVFDDLSTSLRDLVDEHRRTESAGGAQSDAALRASLDRLGGALEGSGVSRVKRERVGATEAAERTQGVEDRAAFQSGREMAVNAWRDTPAEGRAAVRAALEANARTNPTEKNRGALDAFDEASRAGNTDSVYQQRTGRLARETAATIPSDTVSLGGDANARDWRGQAPETDAPDLDTDIDLFLSPEPKTAKAAPVPDLDADVDAFLE